MLGVVHAVLLDLPADPDADGALAAEEDDGGHGSDPRDDREAEDEVGGEAAAVTSVEDTGALLGAVAVVSVGVLQLGGEEADGDGAPEAAESVNGDGTDDVVDLELLQQQKREC